MDAICDLDDFARRVGGHDGRRWLRGMARRRGYVIQEKPYGTVLARVDHGRWIADCPFCAGAELVSRQMREFFCLSCGMAANAGRPMRVIFPRRLDRIEEILSRRAERNRNWQPGESISALRRENREHGLEG